MLKKLILCLTISFGVKATDVVTVTTYSATRSQTDSTPKLTASGYKITRNTKRIVALSRDLKRKYKFGSRVRITGIGKYSGIYTVRDVTHRRFSKRVDILIGRKDKHAKFKKAKISRV